MKQTVTVLLLWSICFTPVFAGTFVERYQVPNVKDDFCGLYINFQYCKCAFHNEYCDAVGLSPGSAGTYVLNEFRAWNKDRIQAMGMSCVLGGGYWNRSNWSCTMCTEGDVLEGRTCVPPAQSDAEKRECREALQNIETNWEKYSDFDDRLGSDVSYEVQQFNNTMDEIAELVARAQQLEYDMEIDRHVRLSLREYKQALVQNIKTNLLKAFWRLSYVTYTTIQGAKGTHGSLTKMLNPDSVVEGVGAGLKVIQASIPPAAKDYQIDTSTTAGKIKSIAWNATLETIESVGNPKDIAVQFAKDVRGAAIPSPNISDEEIGILRDQHLSNQAIDVALAESYALNAERRAELLNIEKEIGEKYNELQDWKFKEYQRVKANLTDQCKETNE
jgi:hypothetical protein